MSVLAQVPDLSRESFPYLLYTKIPVIYDRIDVTFPLDYGFSYIVERINARYNSQNSLIPGTYADPPLIEFFKDGGNTALQLAPFPISLMSSPSESGEFVDTAPGANPAYPFTARPLNRSKALNVLYYFRDVIHMVVSGITAITVPGDPNGSLPSYIELMIKGRYFPLTQQIGWQK
jgi:hypothetical protein